MPTREVLETVLITGIAGHAALSPAYIILAGVGQRPAVLSCRIDKCIHCRTTRFYFLDASFQYQNPRCNNHPFCLPAFALVSAEHVVQFLLIRFSKRI